MSNYFENSVPRAKVPCLLTGKELVSLGFENLTALRKSAEYCCDHALGLFNQGAFGTRFAFYHDGQYYAMDESEATGMIMAESEAQIKRFDNVLEVAKKETVPYLPEFRPEGWLQSGTRVYHCYHTNKPSMTRGIVDVSEPPLLDVEDKFIGVRARYHAKSPLIMSIWEREYFRDHPDFAVTWIRVIEALTPSTQSDRRNYNLLAALLGPTGP